MAAALGASPLAAAATFVTVAQQSESEQLGTRFSTAADGGTVSAQMYPGNRYQVSVLAADSSPLHTFEFTGPDGSQISVGRYDNASPAAAVPGFASLDYVKGNTGCGSGAPGYFIVREFQYPSGPDGLAHVAIDYFHQCGTFVDIRRPTHTFGSIRLNSDVPAMEFPPWADGGPDIYVDEGDPFALGAERSYFGDAPITGIRYRQLSGPPVNIPADGAVNVAAPSVPGSGTVLSFELEVTNALGLTATDVVDVHVDRLDGRRTFIELQGEPGNYVLGASKILKRYANGAFALIDTRASTQLGMLGIDFFPQGPGAPLIWGFSFTSGSGQPMTTGVYDDVFGVDSDLRPTMMVGGDGHGCNQQSGRYIVRELDIDPLLSTIRTLALDFEQICEDRAAVLRGWIRLNSAVAVSRAAPTAIGTSSAGLVDVGANVTLDASTSTAGDGTITSWQWQQIHGTPVTLVGTNQAGASFVVPAVPSTGDVLTFWVTVTNSLGFTDTVEVPIVVRAPAVVTPPVSPPTPGGGAGSATGGGGAMSPFALLFLSTLLLRRLLSRSRRAAVQPS